MSLRSRLTVAGGGAVFLALAIASLVIYVSVRSNLQEQLNASLIQLAEGVASKWNVENTLESPKAELGKGGSAAGKLAAGGTPRPLARGPVLGSDGDGYFQVIPDLSAATNQQLPPTEGGKGPLAPSLDGFVSVIGVDASVATGVAPPYFRDVRYRNVPMRLYTMGLSSERDGLIRAARPLTGTNATINRIRWLLLGLTLGGAIAAGLLGRLAANAVLRPVRTLAGAVRGVSATRDLKQRIPVTGRDELASLANDFNGMLAALDESQHAQQQLIADASHELRTPLTAHRTNLELLARPDLPAEQRQRVLGAAMRAMERLSALVGDLILAARDGRSVDAREPLALDELVASAVERAEHRAPALRFATRLEPYRMVGAGSRVERALDNVLDNAIKWSPPGGTIDVNLADGRLTVRDHGPGIAETDLPHVFDRFYRAAAARSLPGSGLGLAIVKQTVDDHGGSVTVANADGGGAFLTLRFDPNGSTL
jgi:two-component system, OmpR family, sensor histidine kinase MprB